MSDVMPDYQLEQQRLRVQLSGLAQNVERYILEILEARSREAKAKENLVATKEAIQQTQGTLDSLVTAHGALEDIENG